jgi:hypothetical protein
VVELPKKLDNHVLLSPFLFKVGDLRKSETTIEQIEEIIIGKKLI